MSYRLDWSRPLDDEVRAVATARLEHAAAGLTDGSDPAEAVHSARKDVKKTRALLRLARAGLPAKAYGRENAALRDIGRSLSAARDAHVLLETLDGLRERAVGQAPEPGLEAIRAVLARRGAGESGSGTDAAAGEASALLTQAAARVERWPLRLADADIATGITTAYARGRDAFAQAQRAPEAENLHEWRKRVKDLWYHQRLLEDAFPEVMPAYAKATKHLSELLGDDHDLAVLREVLVADVEQEGGPEVEVALPALVGLIDERRAELEAEAFGLGHRLYAESPKAFRRRIRRLLAAVRSAQTPTVRLAT